MQSAGMLLLRGCTNVRQRTTIFLGSFIVSRGIEPGSAVSRILAAFFGMRKDFWDFMRRWEDAIRDP